jgi:hypothetical protein
MILSDCSKQSSKRLCATHRRGKPLNHSIQLESWLGPPGKGVNVAPNGVERTT